VRRAPRSTIHRAVSSPKAPNALVTTYDASARSFTGSADEIGATVEAGITLATAERDWSSPAGAVSPAEILDLPAGAAGSIDEPPSCRYALVADYTAKPQTGACITEMPLCRRWPVHRV
jgi:hypothetical protein